MIGLSFTWCVRKIADGTVALEDVEKIISSTRHQTAASWDTAIASNRINAWRSTGPDKCENVARWLLAHDKIEQPRLENDQHFPMLIAPSSIPDHPWVEDESDITWCDEIIN